MVALMLTISGAAYAQNQFLGYNLVCFDNGTTVRTLLQRTYEAQGFGVDTRTSSFHDIVTLDTVDISGGDVGACCGLGGGSGTVDSTRLNAAGDTLFYWQDGTVVGFGLPAGTDLQAAIDAEAAKDGTTLTAYFPSNSFLQDSPSLGLTMGAAPNKSASIQYPGVMRLSAESTGMRITDSRTGLNAKGLVYTADYCAGILANPLSVPSVGCVSQIIGDSLAGISTGANISVSLPASSKNGGLIKLGSDSIGFAPYLFPRSPDDAPDGDIIVPGLYSQTDSSTVKVPLYEIYGSEGSLRAYNGTAGTVENFFLDEKVSFVECDGASVNGVINIHLDTFSIQANHNANRHVRVADNFNQPGATINVYYKGVLQDTWTTEYEAVDYYTQLNTDGWRSVKVFASSGENLYSVDGTVDNRKVSITPDNGQGLKFFNTGDESNYYMWYDPQFGVRVNKSAYFNAPATFSGATTLDGVTDVTGQLEVNTTANFNYRTSVNLGGIDFFRITDTRASKLGMEYVGDYSADIRANPRSVPDVGTVAGIISDSLATVSGAADSTLFATNYRLDTAKANLRTEIAAGGGGGTSPFFDPLSGLGASSVIFEDFDYVRNGVALAASDTLTPSRKFLLGGNVADRTGGRSDSCISYIALDLSSGAGRNWVKPIITDAGGEQLNNMLITSHSWDFEVRYKWTGSPGGSGESIRIGWTDDALNYGEGLFYMHNNNGVTKLVNDRLSSINEIVSGTSAGFEKWTTVRVTYNKASGAYQFFLNGTSVGTASNLVTSSPSSFYINYRTPTSTDPDGNGVYLDYFAMRFYND